jgi:hypothetical protein
LFVSIHTFEKQALGFEEKLRSFLPLLKKIESIKVKADTPLVMKIQLDSDWRINPQAQSWLRVFESTQKEKFKFIKQYSHSQLSSLSIKIPPLTHKKYYRIQAIFYFCKKGEREVCRIQSLDFELHPAEDENNLATEFSIQLGL